jgi:hypothetical protein
MPLNEGGKNDLPCLSDIESGTYKNRYSASQRKTVFGNEIYFWKAKSCHAQTFLYHPSHLVFLQHQPFLRNIVKSCQSNTLNLNRHTLRQLINRHTAPRRLMRKELLINAIHLHETIHSRQEHVDLDNLLNRRASGFENCRQILDAEFCHGGDGRGFESEDFTGGRAGNLARAVDCGGGGYCLGLGHVRHEESRRGWERT